MRLPLKLRDTCRIILGEIMHRDGRVDPAVLVTGEFIGKCGPAVLGMTCHKEPVPGGVMNQVDTGNI